MSKAYAFLSIFCLIGASCLLFILIDPLLDNKDVSLGVSFEEEYDVISKNFPEAVLDYHLGSILLPKFSIQWGEPDFFEEELDLFGYYPAGFYAKNHSMGWQLHAMSEKKFKYQFEGFVYISEDKPKLFFADPLTGQTYWVGLNEVSLDVDFEVIDFEVSKSSHSCKVIVRELSSGEKYVLSDNFNEDDQFQYSIKVCNRDNPNHLLEYEYIGQENYFKDVSLKLILVNNEEKQLVFLETNLKSEKMKKIYLPFFK